MRFYLAHPFDTRKIVRRMELLIEDVTGIELVNPFYDLDRNDVVQIDTGRAGRYEKLDYTQLVLQDLEVIESCPDGLVAYIPWDCFQFGTPCECWYAMEQGRPVYIISEQHYNHPWIKFIARQSGGEVFKGWGAFDEWIEFAIGHNRLDRGNA